MKRILGILSVLLILVGFTNEAKAEVKQDNTVVIDIGFTYQLPLVVAIDNVFVVGVANVIVSTVNYKDVGGSIISNDAKIPDQDNLYSSTIVSKIYKLNKNTFGGERTSLVKHKYRLASNDEVKDVNLKVDVGKTFTSSRNTLNEYAGIT